MGELAATLALAQDNAFGQPLESQLRSCLLAARLAGEMGLDADLRATVYWVALLRYLGCTGHAHEVAALFGDEIAIRAQTLVHDAANPAEVMRDVVAFATASRPAEERDQVIAAIHAGAREWAVNNFASGCEVADMLAQRLGFSRDVRDALRFTFERWNGQGFPDGASGADIPLAMRIVHLSHDMEAIGRLQSPGAAISAAGDRRDRTYDPALADVFAAHGADWFDELAKTDPWDAVLDLEPAPHWTLAGDQLENAVTVVADFIDLKSPYMAGHSRRCARLCHDAAIVLGFTDDARTTLRRAALVHDFGTTAIPNSIWDKPSPLTRAEFDRVELHPMLTEQMLRRSPALAELNPVAAAHHERGDGSGYHKRVPADAIDLGAGILAAADVYAGMTTDRADRPALSDQSAAGELRRLAAEGQIDRRATGAVLAAAGHVEHHAQKEHGRNTPAGSAAARPRCSASRPRAC
ncbi:MAG TPA: HD domain-containing phosphohydrolase [Streptosporangiaceae bacterium]|nr:HD domain-containing phosphohydrolase [Streptosporangiaceae bacterium]